MYSYDRSKVATSGVFYQFKAIPRQATTGSSLTPIQATIRQVGDDAYSMAVVVRGTMQGDIQEVTDALRFVAAEVKEFCANFFRLPPTMKGSLVTSLSGQTIAIGGNGLTMTQNLDFRMPGMSPDETRRAVESASRFFTNIAEISLT